MVGSGLRALTSKLDHRRRVVLALLVVATLGLTVGGGAAPDSTTWTGLRGQGVLAILLQAALALGLLAIVAAVVVLRHPQRQAPQRRGSWHILVLVVIVAALAAFLPRDEAELAEFESEQGELAEPAPPTPSRGGGGLATSDLVVLLAILVGGLGILWWGARAEPDPDLGGDDEPDPGDRLTPAIGRASEHLFQATDPRAAVMLAYRELERTLEQLDLPRSPVETPTEHLARALGRLPAIGPAGHRPLLDLADLYQTARFSEHSITADDQQRAAEALRDAHLRLTGVAS